MVWHHENPVAATAGSSGIQSSVDTWEHAKPKGEWKEVSAEYEVLDALVKEKKITQTKSGKESAKREADLYTMLESAEKLFSKGKKRKMRQRASWKKLKKTWRPHNTKVLRRSEVCAALSGNTSTVTTEIGVERGH